MTKGFRKDKNGQFKSLSIAGHEVDNNDSTYGLAVVPGNLMHPDLRHNKKYATSYNVTVNQWNELIHWRPTAAFRKFLNIRNTVTGAVNISTQVLDLNNGTGAAGAGDVFIITWKHEFPDNDNLKEVHLWLKRNLVALVAASTVRVALCDITGVATLETGVITDLGAGNHDMTPLTLDKEFIHSTAIAYAERLVSDIPSAGNGGPVEFRLRYNAHEEKTGLVKDHVYALVVYLYQANVGDLDTISIYGTQLSTHDAKSATYFGAAGWNGLIAEDATVKSAFMILSATLECVINQIHIYAENGQTLGGSELGLAAVTPDAELLVTNLPTSEKIFKTRNIIHDLHLADQKVHSIIFEGKVHVPRRHFLKFIIMVGYTGEITIEINFWANTCGNKDLLN